MPRLLAKDSSKVIGADDYFLRVRSRILLTTSIHWFSMKIGVSNHSNAPL